MNTVTIAALATIGGIVLVMVFALVVRLYSMHKELAASFSKLGFIVREDAKRYFDEASAKMIDTNLSFRESYVEIVEQGTASAMNQTAQSIEGSIIAAQQEANQIILRARDDARRINVEARKMAVDEMSRSLENAADTISWVMERFVGETFSMDEHRYLIDRLVTEYLNEYQS